jgi:hypothetical protein
MGSKTLYTKHIDKFTNTEEFSYLAKYFYEHKSYCPYPAGTYQHKKFWEDVREKCMNGMTNSAGISITGQYFYYLNFVQILAKDDNTGKKTKLFPKFVDLDWEYFELVEYARKNQKGMITVKGRRQGYSYKAAAIVSHEFNFYRDSSCLIGAYFSTFSANTMRMVIDNCNFLNRYTEFKKQRNPDLQDHIRARYKVTVDGLEIWKGYNSVCKSVTFKDNEFAAVGNSANWLVFDEAGIFDNIIQAYNMSEPLIKDGSEYIGVALLFGSSGDMEKGSLYFKEMFEKPSTYNMLEFAVEDSNDKRQGFFSSASRGRWGRCRNPQSVWYKQLMVDKDGNSNEQAAIDDILFEREQKKRNGDLKALRDFISQYPLTVKEAFMMSTRNVFPAYLAEERLAELESDSLIYNSFYNGELTMSSMGEITYRNTEAQPITKFPLPSIEDKKGCIQIFEQPYQDNPKFGIYIAGIDTYDDDDSTTDSLGSIFIANSITKKIVAEYTGRPETAKEFYEICRRLLLYYNAIANYENNKKGLFAYFEQRNCLHLLCDTPKILKDMEIVKVNYLSGNNAKGTNATTGVNIFARGLIKSYMLEPIEGSTAEKLITLTHTIPSVGLLREMIAYHADINCDRISSLGMLLILLEDRYKIIIEDDDEDLKDKLDYFDRHWRGLGNNNSYNGIDLNFLDKL